MVKLSIISFGPNPRIVAKFQTDRFRTFGENPRKKNKETTRGKTYPRGLAAATLRYADAAGSIIINGKPLSLFCTCKTNLTFEEKFANFNELYNGNERMEQLWSVGQ